METSRKDDEQAARNAELASSSTPVVPTLTINTDTNPMQPSSTSRVPSLTINTRPVHLATTFDTPNSSTDSMNSAITALDADDESYGRRGSTHSALTSETLLNSPLFPAAPAASFWKGKQKADQQSPESESSPRHHDDGGLLSPLTAERRDSLVCAKKSRRHRHRHPGYGTVDPFDREATGPVRAFGTPRERAIALVRCQREYPEWAGKLRWLQQVSSNYEEEEERFSYVYARHYRRLYFNVPSILDDAMEYDPERQDLSCWPREVNRTNVSVVWALYAMAMLYLCLYGPRVVTSIFATT